MKVIGKNFRKAREKAGLNPHEAYQKIEASVESFENGTKLIPFSVLRKAALVFDVSLSAFFEGV